jgi:hypothetical protein
VIGLSLLGAVFAAEGWYTIQYNQDLLAGSLFILIGLLLAFFLAGHYNARERLYTILLMLPFTGLGMGVFVLIARLADINIL